MYQEILAGHFFFNFFVISVQGYGWCPVSPVAVHGSFIGFHDHLHMGPRIPQRAYQLFRPRFVQGIFKIIGIDLIYFVGWSNSVWMVRQGFYLPWTMLAVDLLIGNRLKPAILGIVAGHIYYFLSVLYPLSGGNNFLKTPYLVYPLSPKQNLSSQLFY